MKISPILRRSEGAPSSRDTVEALTPRPPNSLILTKPNRRAENCIAREWFGEEQLASENAESVALLPRLADYD
jgi:hypothetical protein